MTEVTPTMETQKVDDVTSTSIPEVTPALPPLSYGLSIIDVPLYDGQKKLVDQHPSVWNKVAETYAKYHVGIEMRYVLPVPKDKPLPPGCQPVMFCDAPAGIFVVDSFLPPKPLTGSEKRKNGSEAVHDLLGTVFDTNRVVKNVKMHWINDEVAWRSYARVEPFEVGEPAIYFEALPGNIKLTTGLDIDKVARGEIPIPPLFEYDREDAPKSEKRIWVIPQNANGMVKVETKYIDVPNPKNK